MSAVTAANFPTPIADFGANATAAFASSEFLHGVEDADSNWVTGSTATMHALAQVNMRQEGLIKALIRDLDAARRLIPQSRAQQA